tara:strand:+ start:1889 stop:2245 length:357 start_codon:yes stop_codon:yes gene_type:complete
MDITTKYVVIAVLLVLFVAVFAYMQYNAYLTKQRKDRGSELFDLVTNNQISENDFKEVLSKEHGTVLSTIDSLYNSVYRWHKESERYGDKDARGKINTLKVLFEPLNKEIALRRGIAC